MFQIQLIFPPGAIANKNSHLQSLLEWHDD